MSCLEGTLKRRGVTLSLAAILAVISLTRVTPAQTCGDLDYSGGIDLTDLSILIDHLILTHTPLTVPDAAADCDGVPGVTMNDLLTMLKYMEDQIIGAPSFLDCSVTPDSTYPPSEDTVTIRRLSSTHYQVWMHAIGEYNGLSLTLSYDCLTSTPHVLSIVGMDNEVDSTAQRLFLHNTGLEVLPDGDHLFADLYFEFDFFDLGLHYVTFELADFSPSHATVLSREGVGYRTFDGFLPTLEVDQSNNCCWLYTGNVDCDPDDVVDVSDIQALIDNLFQTMSPLCCEAEANINYPGSGYAETDDIVDITDLTILIDNQYLSLAPLSTCP